ncbi:zinc ribbon domain-containing protein [Desulfogranum mediterraneum]|uniref:zinc ribbon domain-containing protein n=1 Tax=Desulfogranum mediterraneum TaxID=160661 RepID=UPI00041A880E|nr:zinc ribbon domain-containing protein [Desulfogranum mediterraneum]
MDIRVEQGCPQCGAPAEQGEDSRWLCCAYCGVRTLLSPAGGLFRYLLPPATNSAEPEDYYAVPYLRFKGMIFQVSSQGISHRLIDTTQVATELPGLPPSLGLRPQAMVLRPLSAAPDCRYLPQSRSPRAVLKKAIQVGGFSARPGGDLYHRAYIGESLSVIYLPLVRQAGRLLDGVSGLPLAAILPPAALPGQAAPFAPSWQLSHSAAICPHCGWDLEAAADDLVVHCAGCHRAWQLAGQGLRQVEWQLCAAAAGAVRYLPFWRIPVQIPALELSSFSDLVQRTNQPLVARSAWSRQPLQFWIPAMKLRPKLFLQLGRRLTLGQWRLPDPAEPHPAHRGGARSILAAGATENSEPYPVTLGAGEAGQAIKVLLAAMAASPRRIHPQLPRLWVQSGVPSLCYLPFEERGQDWVQLHCGVALAKSALRFGRLM